VTESFVDLGGHSLLSAQLIVEVEQVLGRPLPEQALAELGTIEDMARIVEADLSTRAAAINETGGDTMPEVLHRLRRYTASWIGTRVDPSSVLVGLNVGGRLTPLIWVLQRYQELTQLARYLGPERPVYGLRSARRVLERTPDNLARLASHYADEILAARPEGPYAVGGNCGATQVALPLAQELKARGCDVALLFMHEKFIAQPYAGRVALLFGAQSDRNPFKQYADPAHGWRKHYRGPVTVDIVSGAHAEFFVEPNVQVLTAAIRRRMEELDVRAPPAGAFPPGDGLLPLPAGAHRARFTVRPPAPVRPGERFRLDVEVRNVSASPWPAGERSGIALVNRWLDPKRRPVVWLDGRTPLPVAVAAGAAINLELVVTAPATPGSWLLVFDLVEEGVTTFSSVSSEAGAVAVVVDDGPAVRG
jgi:hypothetical protein